MTETITRPPEPWRQRLIRTLLYGRNVDRSAKARARAEKRASKSSGA